ncbi:unnamed protein product [Urochloa humidicola]
MTTPATGGVASRISSGGTRGQRHHVGRRIERGSPCRPPSPAGRQRSKCFLTQQWSTICGSVGSSVHALQSHDVLLVGRQPAAGGRMSGRQLKFQNQRKAENQIHADRSRIYHID